MVSSSSRAAVIGLAAAFLAPAARADDVAIYYIQLKDHRFTPSELHVAAGKPFIVEVSNESDAGDEFEMLIPSVERRLAPRQHARVLVRPLGVGQFTFVGENDPDNEKGVFITE